MKAKIKAVAGVQLLLVGQVQATINQLQPARNISDDAVHAMRKYLKRARALLRLLRPALSTRVYRREKNALRGSSRQLTRLRDIKVLLDSVQQLLKELRYKPADVVTTPIYQRLKKDRTQERKALLGSHINTLIGTLQSSRRRISSWQATKSDHRLLTRSLKKTYKRGRRALAEVKRVRSDEKLHDLRKRTKSFEYQLTALKNLKLGKFKKIIKHARKLGSKLGDDHDLATLQNYDRNLFADPRITEAVNRRRAKLQYKAFNMAKRLYATKPRKLLK